MKDSSERSTLEALRDAELALPRFSLERRITVLVLTLTIVVVGLVAALGLPLEMLPRGFTGSSLGVNVPWRDAPAEETMDKILLPLEEELSTVAGLDRINSYANSGWAQARLMFKQGTDMKVAYREVRDRIERARARLPADADRVFIRKEDTSGFPIAFVVVTVDPSLTDPYDLVQNEVLLRLERIDGIASVEAHGLEEKEILIELDRQATEGAGLNIYELAQELGGDNFSLASGTVYSGSKKLLLRSLARYSGVEQLKARPVAPNVRLGDIATVSYAEPEKQYRAKVTGKPSYFVEVLKEGDANTVEVSDALRAEVERLKENPRLSGVEVKLVFDQGNVIRESLDSVLSSGKVGALLGVAVLFFFLRRFRMTLIITLSIPLSLLVALAAMYFGGETFNILSLLGLMICVGMLVDNSIVVAENVYRLYREGLSRREAAIRGAGEIALAITLATLTSVIVFLPVSLVEGEIQFFLLRLSIPITVALLASLGVALVLVPLAVYLTLPESHRDEETRISSAVHRTIDRTFERLYEATLGRVSHFYERLLAFFLGPRRFLDLAVVLVLLVAGAVALLSTKTVKVSLADQDERSSFEIGVELPEAYTLEDADQHFEAIEATLKAKQSEIGYSGYFYFYTARWGQIQAWVERGQKLAVKPREATARMLKALPERAGVEYTTGNDGDDGETKEATETLTLFGEDPAELETLGKALEKRLAEVPGVLAVKRESERPLSELALVIDRDRAERQGVNPTAVAGMVGYALRGQSLPRFYTEGRDIPVRVRFEEADRDSLAALADFDVPTEGGSRVALSSVTDVRFLPAAKRIERRSKRIARPITLELIEGQEEKAREGLKAAKARIDLPEGVSWGRGGAEEAREEDMRDQKAFGMAALLSIVFIYLLMAFLFESFILPVSILMTIPLAFIGVVGLHWAFGRPLDMLGFVGVVLLIGVVVNNGIVLIDYVNRLRQEGVERTEAILKATRDRFRPILMTALTTIFGTLPLIWGEPSSIGLSYKSFGLTLTGGMSAATLLTLLVVPVAYAVLDDVQKRLSQLVTKSLKPKSAEPTEASWTSA